MRKLFYTYSMKGLLLLVQFVFFTVIAFGAPNNFYENKHKVVQRSDFLARALEGKIHIQVEYLYSSPSVQEERFFNTAAPKAINAWFEAAAQAIKEEGREEEFKDIYPLFSRGVDIIFPSEKPDVIVKVVKTNRELHQKCKGECTGGYYEYTHELYVSAQYFAEKGDEYLRTFIHEFGHAFGLADQYDEEVYTNPLISYQFGSPETFEDSIMDYYAQQIGLDDVDGLINAIDLERVAQGHPSPRGPWRGFAKKYTYLNGKEISSKIGKLEYTIEESQTEEGEPCWNMRDKDGNHWDYILDNLQVPLKWDDLFYKKPIELESEIIPFSETKGTGANGENVICVNLFQKTYCFAFLNDKLVWTQLFWRSKYGKDSNKILRILSFKFHDVAVVVEWVHPDSTSMVSKFSYVESHKGKKFIIEMELNSQCELQKYRLDRGEKRSILFEQTTGENLTNQRDKYLLENLQKMACGEKDSLANIIHPFIRQ